MGLWIALYLPCQPSAQGQVNESLQHLARNMQDFTPEVALPEPTMLVMAVQASLQLFSGIAALCRLVKHRSCQCLPGVSVRMAVAPSARGAMLLARFPPGRIQRVLSVQSLARQLASIPVQALPAARSFLPWLNSIGCSTLGKLNALPRGGLQQRTSPELVQQLHQAYAQAPQGFTWFKAAPGFHYQLSLNSATEHAQTLLQAAVPVLQQACAWLDQHKLVCHALLFQLHHETGRHARAPTPVRVVRANAGWQANDFLPLLAQQLQGLVLTHAVVALGVSITATQARHTQAASLFPTPLEQRKLENHVLDLIRARLGSHAIRVPDPVADYLPEHANQWQANTGWPDASHQNPIGQANPALRTDLAPASRPAWLINPPRPVETRNNRPVYAGKELRLIHGPERIETRWWAPAGHQQRDYFIAQSPDGVRYWVYRQRNGLQLHWFLHGLFG